MTIGIIDVGIGNIGSLQGALYNQGWDTETITNPKNIAEMSHIILPGVGSYSSAMNRIVAAELDEPIKQHVTDGKPLLGICLGMHLLAEKGTEGGISRGLELIQGNIIPLEKKTNFRLPHVGWNVVQFRKEHAVMKNIKSNVDFYFVHNFYFNATKIENVFGVTDHGMTYPSVVAEKSVIGLQFHPEKSQANGLQILENFCLWDGLC